MARGMLWSFGFVTCIWFGMWAAAAGEPKPEGGKPEIEKKEPPEGGKPEGGGPEGEKPEGGKPEGDQGKPEGPPQEIGDYVLYPVRCEAALDYRERLGLPREPRYPLHLTIGNLK